MTVSDNAQIEVRNLSSSPVVFVDDVEHRRYYFNNGQTIKVKADTLRRLNGSIGGGVLLRDYLCVQNEELAKELGISEDLIEHEYSWTKDDIRRVLTEGSLDELKDALEFAPEGIIQSIVDMAVELPLNDMAKRQTIRDFTGLDITAKIKNKNDYETATGTVEKVPEQRQRRVQKNEETQDSGRRVS